MNYSHIGQVAVLGCNLFGQDSQQLFGRGRFKNINTKKYVEHQYKELSRTSIKNNYKVYSINSHVTIRYELLSHRECIGGGFSPTAWSLGNIS